MSEPTVEDARPRRHRGPVAPTCHCGETATQQAHREATDEEAAAYHRGVDEWRTSQGLPPMPENAAVRQQPVMVPVFGCDEHGTDHDTADDQR